MPKSRCTDEWGSIEVNNLQKNPLSNFKSSGDTSGFDKNFLWQAPVIILQKLVCVVVKQIKDSGVNKRFSLG